MLEKVTSSDDRALCSTIIADLQGGPQSDADILSRLNPGLHDRFAAILPQLHTMTPRGPGAAARLVDGSSTVFINNGHTLRDSYLAYEVDAGNRRALVRFDIARQDGQVEVNALYLNPLYVPVEEINKFSLSNKSMGQYAVLALTVLSFLTIITSEIALFLTRKVRLKWLWAIGCLFGYGQISIDWAGGASGFAPIYIQLFGAFFLKSGVLEPWRIGFGVPVVSIVFLGMLLNGRLPRLPDKRRNTISASTP